MVEGGRLRAMKRDLVKLHPVALLPTPSGCAVFLGDNEKVILIYIDPSIGAAINMGLQGEKLPRPMTHDLFHDALGAFGAKVTRVVIVDVDGDVYFARLFIEAQNEINQKKIVELDARPSDCIALAVREKAPIYMVKSIWEDQADVSELLEQMKEMHSGHEGEGGDDA